MVLRPECQSLARSAVHRYGRPFRAIPGISGTFRYTADFLGELAILRSLPGMSSSRRKSEMKAFYGDLFGWSLQDWGTVYKAFSESGVDGGFNAGGVHRTKARLVIIETSDIHSMEQRVKQAVRTITLPMFEVSCGRRFHLIDPSGNELAVMQLDCDCSGRCSVETAFPRLAASCACRSSNTALGRPSGLAG